MGLPQASLSAVARVSSMYYAGSENSFFPYFLVDEVLIIIFNTQFTFHFLDLRPLQKDLPFNAQHFLPG